MLPAPPSPPLRGDRSTARAGVAGGLAVLLLVVATAGVVMGVRHHAEAADARDDAAVALRAPLPADVLTRLGDEVGAALARFVGVPLGGESPVSFEDTVEAMDKALASFRARVTGGSKDEADAFGPALDRTDAAIHGLRARVPMAPDLTRLDEAQTVIAGYEAAILDLLAADSSYRQDLIGDATIRRGVELHDLAVKQAYTVRRLSTLLTVTSARGGLTTSDAVADVSAGASQLRTNDRAIGAEATGPYRAAAHTLLTDPAHDALTRQVSDALQGRAGGPVQVVQLDASLYTDFRHRVERAVATHADDRAAAHRAAQVEAFAVAVVAGLLAAAAAAVAVRAARRS